MFYSKRAGSRNCFPNVLKRPMKAKRNGAPLQVYDGQKLIGEIEDHGRRNVAAYKFEGPARVEIGVFPTRIAATRAVASSIAPACCADEILGEVVR